MKFFASFVILVGVAASAGADSYDSLSACEKEAVLWQAVEDSEYESLPAWKGTEPLKLFGFALPFVRQMGRRFMRVTMERESDVMPDERFKHIHTYGSVVPVRFVAKHDTPFTGTLEGVECGLMRVSLAAKPQGDTTTPGLAVKFLIDGHPSLNFMSMYSLDGQQGYNFFKNDFSNFVEPPQNPLLKTLASVFALVSVDPTKIDVSFLASRRANGEIVPPDQRVAPYQIFLIPNREELNFADAAHEVRDDFATIAPGTSLYTVFAQRKGSNQRVEVGAIETKDRFISSSFGDSRLFFRHEAIDGK